jgi:thiamine pyrophosphokinase
MSSHHIVRDEQEPALCILNPEACELSQIQELLEWSPTVLVAQSAVEKILTWGIKIDKIIIQTGIDFDLEYDPATIMYVEKIETESNSLDTVLKWLIQQNYAHVNLIMLPDELDILADYIELIEIVIYHQKGRTFSIQGEWKKWLSKGSGIVIEGNYNSMQNLNWSADRLAYIAAEDGIIAISPKDRTLWITELK